MSDTRRPSPRRTPPRPDRVRRIHGGFAFLPNRFLHHGFFASLDLTLDHPERSLYLFLVLAADRDGVSFYAYDRICSILEMTIDDYLLVRNNLIDKDLIAFDGTRFQVLALPPHPIVRAQPPLVSPDDRDDRDPATIRQLIRSSLHQQR